MYQEKNIKVNILLYVLIKMNKWKNKCSQSKCMFKMEGINENLIFF